MLTRSEAAKLVGQPFIDEKDGFAFYKAFCVLDNKMISIEDYLISPQGLVYSLKSNKVLKSSTDKDGYLKVSLYEKGKKLNVPIHKLVGSTFHYKECIDILTKDTLVFDHINRVRTDNDYTNIRPTIASVNVRNISFNDLIKRQDNMREVQKKWAENCKKKVVIGDLIFDSLKSASKFLFNEGCGKDLKIVEKNLSQSLTHNRKCYGYVVSYGEVV